MSESDHQAALVKWFKIRWPEYVIHSIPNGTHIRSFKGRQKAKNEGLYKGVSDLFIVVPRGTYHGFYLEMKDEGKKESSLTPEQKSFIQYARWAGYHADWAAGVDEARKKILEYMSLKKH